MIATRPEDVWYRVEIDDERSKRYRDEKYCTVVKWQQRQSVAKLSYAVIAYKTTRRMATIAAWKEIIDLLSSDSKESSGDSRSNWECQKRFYQMGEDDQAYDKPHWQRKQSDSESSKSSGASTSKDNDIASEVRICRSLTHFVKTKPLEAFK